MDAAPSPHDAVIASAAPIVEIAAASAAVVLDAVEDVVIPEPLPAAEPARRSRRDARADRAAAPVPEIGPEAFAMPEPLPRRATLRAPRPAPAAEPVVETVLTPVEPFELVEPSVAEPVELVQPAAAEPIVEDRITPFALIEPSVAEPVEEIATEDAEGAASIADDFEAAARLFSFTGETAIITEEPSAPVDEPIIAHAVPRKARRTRGLAFKRIAATSFSIGVFGVVGLMTVGMTTPAEAVAAAGGTTTSAMSVVAPGDVETEGADADAIQAYVAPATTEDIAVARSENYATVSMAEIARESGIQNFSNLFVNDPTSPIQWPFAVGVPMSYGFGMRSGAMHQGIDFTPGAGSPIQAIADGTVRVASESGGAYGVHVIIDHIIDGQLVSSHYAHMQYGSLQVVPGQQVTVGTVLGHTGNTGRSFGAHTHFEILQNGTTPIDPLPWLRQHAGG
ncbi:peptidoglycan DD-metalloendopeptidase family protein [Microbacterium sp.]|uniref:M23 family metallopeptidase n=1 Tax=Microbacterium sp. TaxID=51671 RepID=UPI003F6EB165